ncbi:MAG TPA: hypothetical protein VFT99_11410, partial [Roseiflexaceae bacterium]|nr:hypothetical protein [Roseiflexaceae bacterium]
MKFPDVQGDGDTVYIGGSTGRSDDRTSRYVTSKFPFETPSDPQGEGNANGQSDYSPTVLARGPDGWIYKVWMRSERGNRGIFIYRKPPNSDAWQGPFNVIAPGNTFRVRVDVAVTATGNGGAGRIFVVWDENSRYRFKFSDNRGESWSGTLLVSEDTTSSRPMLAADPGGGMWIAYSTAGEGDASGRVKAGVFEGDHFNVGDILAKGRNNYFSDPTISVRPNDGVVITAWRDVNGGIYYGELQANSQWATSRLVSGATAYGTVAVVSDPQGNAHLMWAGDTSGQFDFWYAYKPYNQPWQGPVLATEDGDLDANVSVSTTVNGAYSYGHAVGERFTSNGLRTRYVLGRG